MAGEDGASNPFLQPAGSCESVHRGSAGCCGNRPALQASTKGYHSREWGSWGFMASCSEFASDVCPNESAEGVLPA